ncbi:MAG: DUF2797 domain-containing protein [Nitrospinae bacterium]|nr:DUF2797 domain-containing protein [Nitrospinota bacterium]MDA1110510.1 DUF2797 domain-containing protein [Nitrospinota bacterium]
MKISGQLRKMTHEAASPIQYFLSLDENPVPITAQVGNEITLTFSGTITCVECGRKIKKTYNQGYCFPCARDLPENAMCSVRPELCQHEHGNEADREFYRDYCAVDHYVYLSLTSGVKVGITRYFNIPSRWIDQGAVQGLIIAKVPERILSGKIEVALSEHMADKTNWRKMLKGEVDAVDLQQVRGQALEWIPPDLREYALTDQPVQNFTYPVQAVPDKISSHNLDKVSELTGVLTGIKGQYLIFEKTVINLRKYAGYHVEFALQD